MTDIYDKSKRSEIMSAISGKDTGIEVFIRKSLFARGFRYRKNAKSLPGTPDIVLPKYKTVIFAHGCFWHGHTRCRFSRLPATRKEYWEKKIADNKQRDRRNTQALREQGWHVVVIWQCEINSVARRLQRLELLARQIRNQLTLDQSVGK